MHHVEVSYAHMTTFTCHLCLHCYRIHKKEVAFSVHLNGHVIEMEWNDRFSGRLFLFVVNTCTTTAFMQWLSVMQISENLFTGENFEGSDRNENKREKLACQPDWDKIWNVLWNMKF